MSRENEKWFGFILTQKQAVWIFILSLIGVIGTSFIIVSMFYPYLFMLVTSSFFDIDDFVRLLLQMAPMYAMGIIFFVICVYTLIKTRKIAIFYSQNLSQPTNNMKEV